MNAALLIVWDAYVMVTPFSLAAATGLTISEVHNNLAVQLMKRLKKG